MFIRYHLFYYALSAIGLVCAKIHHPLFYVFLFLYWLFLARFLPLKHFVFMILLCIFLQCHDLSVSPLPSTLEGTIVKAADQYCYLQSDVGIVKIYHQNDIEYGDHIRVKVKALTIYEPSNDHAFSEKNYLYGQKIFYKAYLQQILQQEHHHGLYHWIENRLSTHEDVRDYQRLFLLGERSEHIQEDYEVLSDLSLVHMFALSGMHIHLLFAIVKGCLGLFMTQKISRFLTYIIIGIYIFSIPLSISLYRAYFVLLLYDLLKRWFHRLDILSLLVIVSLIDNPYIIYNISFVFSYFVYFIVLLTRSFRYSSLWIYLATVPIILFLNAQIPLIAVVAGQILTTFIEVFYGLCVFSICFSFLEPLLIVYVTLFQKILVFLEASNYFLTFSKPTLSFFIFFYGLYFMMICRQERHQSYRRYALALLSLIISFHIYGQYKIYGEVTMIDVGQGDCTLIRLPMNQGNILIDTGGQHDYDVAQQTIIPYLRAIGIHTLDYVYISHDDYDHCGALASLKEHFHVEKVIDTFEESRDIGCAHIQMFQSQQVYMNSNDNSLIMYVCLPSLNILFTGDASLEVEEDLQDIYRVLDVDLLKVSHHGSQSATSPLLLQCIHPQIAMIGVGEKNLYHHPSQEVIERLERKGIKILRTDQDGMFHIRFYGKSRYIFR